jgi:hypothetical protein
LDGIPSFVVKGYSEVLAPLLKLIFNLSLSMQTFPAAWKKTTIISVKKKAVRPLLVIIV